MLLTFDQLASEVKGHYILQAMQQAYVFVLGLDVLGNPYGLVKDFTKGLGDFFYEPIVVMIRLQSFIHDHFCLRRSLHSAECNSLVAHRSRTKTGECAFVHVAAAV